MTDEHELLTELKRLQYDLTSFKARISEIQRMAASLELPAIAQHKCPLCTITFRAATKLAEHTYHSHDGPLPQHYTDAEKRADEEDAA